MKKAKDMTDEDDILARLQARVEKAITTIQELRRERDQLRARVEELSSLEDDQARYQKERDEIRNRIESILSNLESLDA
jgi:FtsZ-binding cell division protein ZapB